ncbi:MAG TPA: serine hydrolase [Thermoanaerobaculia bacterium]|nr:serine hydrolase [Thermoanaerobaculia bacterium]
MRPIVSLAPLALCLLSCASMSHPSGSLPGEVQRIVARQGKQRLIAVAFHHLGTGATFSLNDRERFHAASTMKVPVMMAFFEAVDRGAMRLDEPVPVRNEFHSIMDDSVYTLDPEEDGDPDLYQTAGQNLPLEELIRRMIIRSSNLATNLLIERIGAPTVMDLMRRIEAYDMRVLRGVEDQKAYDAGMNNVTTANDLRILLKAIADGTTFSRSSSEKMIDILKAQEFNEKIPAGLPPGTPVAHKTGDITGIHHDAAIVFPPGERPYVLVVLTAGFQDEKEADRAIAEISRAVWEKRGMTP